MTEVPRPGRDDGPRLPVQLAQDGVVRHLSPAEPRQPRTPGDDGLPGVPPLEKSAMSDPVVFSRRDFLKLVGIGVAGAAAGCAKPPAEKLLPYLVAPEDILPGVPYWYASTCRECPAGCGVLVKAREGRAIKVEGNANHPVGAGGLCARGQSSLQGLYDPDRLAKPQLRGGTSWKPGTWHAALATVAAKLGAAKGRVLVLTGFESGSFAALGGTFA